MSTTVSSAAGRTLPRLAAPLAAAMLWIVALMVANGDVVGWTLGNLLNLLLMALVGTLVFMVPGLALVRWLWRDVRASFTERIAVACGVGVALPSLLIELASLVRIPWSTPLVVIYVVIAVVALAWQRSWRALLPLSRPRVSAHRLLFLALIAVAFVVRMYIVRGLPVGMWGDSYHHTMIAQLLVDHGGLFTSWQPYAPLRTFTYHYGFHADVAFYHWLSGVGVPRSLVETGQLLSVATLPTMYVLARRLSGNRAVGLWAMLLVGFVNTQPMYYVNWGRYTQLAGQVVLPIVLVCWMAVLESPRRAWRPIALAVIVTACLALIHYIVVLFAILFLGTYVIALLVRDPRANTLREIVIRSVLIVIPAFVLAVPWLWNTLNGYLLQIANNFVNQTASSDYVTERAALFSIAPFYIKTWLLPCAVAGVLAALARRRWRMLLLLAWAQLLIVLVVPQVVGLPGAGIVVWLTVYIVLYLPVLPLAAYPFGLAQTWLARRRPLVAAAGATLALVAVTIWGMQWQRTILAPENQLFSPADDVAMAWIRANTAPDALFLVNMVSAYGDTLVAGTDGGWWIPLLTGRPSTLPPITYGSEVSEDPQFTERTNSFAAALRAHPLPSEEGIRLSRTQGIDYIYVGGGAHTGQREPFSLDIFRDNHAFEIVYERDGIGIVALR